MSFCFIPDKVFSRFDEITPAFLCGRGIRTLICDIDNTLAKYTEPDPPPALHSWLASLAAEDIRVVLLSNNSAERVERFNRTLGLPAFSKSGKPSRASVRRAIAAVNGTPETTAILGDQLFTDVLAGKHSGILTLFVPPIEREPSLFFRTKRLLERPFFAVYRHRAARRFEEKQPPPLLTERLALRECLASDDKALFVYAKNPAVGPSAGWKPHEDIGESRRILARFRESGNIWAVVRRGEGVIIGTVGIHENTSDVYDGIPMLGYAFSEEVWGNGYATEAAKAVISYVFDTENFSALTVSHFTDNEKSRRVIEKCGFTFLKIKPAAFQRFDGKLLDEAWYVLTREAYERQKKDRQSL